MNTVDNIPFNLTTFAVAGTMFAAFFVICVLAFATAKPTDTVGGIRPVPPSVGGPVGVAPVDDPNRSVLEGGTQVKPWLKDQPKLLKGE